MMIIPPLCLTDEDVDGRLLRTAWCLIVSCSVLMFQQELDMGATVPLPSLWMHHCCGRQPTHPSAEGTSVFGMGVPFLPKLAPWFQLCACLPLRASACH
jgi:hypothetical protein